MEVLCRKALVFSCVSVVFQLVGGISSNPQESSTVNNEQFGDQDVQLTKADRKSDYLAQPSYEHQQYQLPGDYGGGSFGSGGGGYGGGHGGGHYHHHHVENHGGDSFKHLLVPLAGVALLGAAALFAANPVLLQLGVISGRKKRSLGPAYESNPDVLERLNNMHLLEKFIEQFPKEQVKRQEKKLLANYLHCSGITDNKNMCLERLTCEIQNPFANATKLEREVLKIVTRDIMENELITDELKLRMQEARAVGSKDGTCERYFCNDVDISKYVQ